MSVEKGVLAGQAGPPEAGPVHSHSAAGGRSKQSASPAYPACASCDPQLRTPGVVKNRRADGRSSIRTPLVRTGIVHSDSEDPRPTPPDPDSSPAGTASKRDCFFFLLFILPFFGNDFGVED